MYNDQENPTVPTQFGDAQLLEKKELLNALNEKLYLYRTAYLTKNTLLPSEVQDDVQNSVENIKPDSEKSLIAYYQHHIATGIDAFFIHNTFSGFSSTLLYEFIRRGLMLRPISAAMLVFLLPLLFAFPHIIYKLNSDAMRDEALRVFELENLNSKKKLFKHQEFKARTRLRDFFNRTVRETFYLSGGIFYLGCAVLFFMGTTPFGFGIVGIITLIICALYFFYDYSQKNIRIHKRDLFFANQAIKEKEWDIILEGHSGEIQKPKQFLSKDNVLKKDLELYNELVQEIRKYQDGQYGYIVEKCESQFRTSSKWLNLISQTFSIQNTFACFTSIALVLFIQYGLMTSLVGMAVMLLIVPTIAALPYFIFKVRSDITKEERWLRIELLSLSVEYAQLTKDESQEKADLIEHQEQPLTWRDFLNNTSLETLFFSGSVFSVGVSVLFIFAFFTPAGWGLISGITMLAGLMYGYHDYQYSKEFFKLKQSVIRKQCEIYELQQTLIHPLPVNTQ